MQWGLSSDHHGACHFLSLNTGKISMRPIILGSLNTWRSSAKFAKCRYYFMSIRSVKNSDKINTRAHLRMSNSVAECRLILLVISSFRIFPSQFDGLIWISKGSTNATLTHADSFSPRYSKVPSWKYPRKRDYNKFSTRPLQFLVHKRKVYHSIYWTMWISKRECKMTGLVQCSKEYMYSTKAVFMLCISQWPQWPFISDKNKLRSETATTLKI
jgi:hypothetical protein